MKKPNRELDIWRANKAHRLRKWQTRYRNRLRHRRWIAQLWERKLLREFPQGVRDRDTALAFKKRLYKRRAFFRDKAVVDISGSFGLEDGQSFDYFIDTAAKFIDFDNKELQLELSACSRAWPSAVTLLASLAQWVELTAHPRFKPRISSTAPKSDEVRGYLSHCGFYDYVHRDIDPSASTFDPENIVKIQRERKRSNLEAREAEIGRLVKRHGDFTAEQMERFECCVLPEIFSNITEHGVPHGDEGWWVLAQLHPTNGFISICLADNGVGVGNSLRFGGQRDHIGEVLGSRLSDDGECIKLALTENVSGSLRAVPPSKSSFLRKQFSSGARRGNGLKRMRDACGVLGVRLTILSHGGFVALNERGEVEKLGSRESRVFAGTLYHLSVRMRKKEMAVNAHN